MKISIGIADDHQLFLKSLSLLIETLPSFAVCMDALNGDALIRKLAGIATHPEIILLDVNMPVLDGPKTAAIISERFPTIKLVALSMKEDDKSVIKMIRAGCCAYLLKDIHPAELEKALTEVYHSGYYNADVSNLRFRRLLRNQMEEEELQISNREAVFLKLASSDLTYRQIADKMQLAERTIDGYRESLFMKLNVQSRVGMVLEALRRNLITLEELQ
jgi:DNA-binding NarL/FixJ family response regulator